MCEEIPNQRPFAEAGTVTGLPDCVTVEAEYGLESGALLRLQFGIAGVPVYYSRIGR